MACQCTPARAYLRQRRFRRNDVFAPGETASRRPGSRGGGAGLPGMLGTGLPCWADSVAALLAWTAASGLLPRFIRRFASVFTRMTESSSIQWFRCFGSPADAAIDCLLFCYCLAGPVACWDLTTYDCSNDFTRDFMNCGRRSQMHSNRG